MLLLALSIMAEPTRLLAQPDTTGRNGIHITSAFAMSTPPGAPTGAAYLTIGARQHSVILTGARSPISEAVELHDMSMHNGMMRMRHIKNLEIAAGDSVEMRPGNGVHLMLIGLKHALKPGDRLPLTLEFQHHPSLEIDVQVQGNNTGQKTNEPHRH